VGTVVVIAGVAFSVVLVGTAGGALVLAPLVVLAENTSGVHHEVRLAEVCR
jgi:predicted N-acetyltransferase YhbS